MEILVLDDDPQIVELMAVYLTRLSYAVVACTSPQEAWSHFSRRPDRFSVVILDYFIPGYQGATLLSQYLAASEHSKILICSGLPVDISVPDRQRSRIGMLLKPFRASQLVAAVQRLVAPRQAEAAAAE